MIMMLDFNGPEIVRSFEEFFFKFYKLYDNIHLIRNILQLKRNILSLPLARLTKGNPEKTAIITSLGSLGLLGIGYLF